MTLIEVVRNLEAIDSESTIYAAQPWIAHSVSLVAREPESGGVPAEADRLGLEYFLEVLIAREVIEGWKSNLASNPTLQETVARLIQYALYDA